VLGDAISAYGDSSDASKTGSTTQDADGNENNGTGGGSGYTWAVVGMLLLLFTSFFATAFNIGEDGTTKGGSPNGHGWLVQVFENAFSLTHFTTYEDKMVFVSSAVYVIYYCARIQIGSFLRKRGKNDSTRTPKPINPVLVSITLAIQRIYGTAETPYTPIIVFLMLTWTMHKISVFERSVMMFRDHHATAAAVLPGQPRLQVHSFHWARAIDIMSDCFMISMLLYTGVIIQVRPASSCFRVCVPVGKSLLQRLF
jgi:hypothetical protein